MKREKAVNVLSVSIIIKSVRKKVRERKMSSKADYLKKYLDSDKKRKKKKVKSRGNLTVKDTDVGWDDIKPASDDEFKPTIG